MENSFLSARSMETKDLNPEAMLIFSSFQLQKICGIRTPGRQQLKGIPAIYGGVTDAKVSQNPMPDYLTARRWVFSKWDHCTWPQHTGRSRCASSCTFVSSVSV